MIEIQEMTDDMVGQGGSRWVTVKHASFLLEAGEVGKGALVSRQGSIRQQGGIPLAVKVRDTIKTALLI